MKIMRALDQIITYLVKRDIAIILNKRHKKNHSRTKTEFIQNLQTFGTRDMLICHEILNYLTHHIGMQLEQISYHDVRILANRAQDDINFRLKSVGKYL